LSKIFKVERHSVSKKLIGLKPVAEAYGYPTFDLAEAARYLVAPPADALEEVISNMRADELPPRLKKEFWDARLSQLTYQEKAGDLWRTDFIVEAFISIFKTLSTSVRGFNGTISRQTGLSDEQRVIINDLMDGLLMSIKDKIAEDPVLLSKMNFLHSDNVDDEIDLVATGKV
jgi:hypothetical protein